MTTATHQYRSTVDGALAGEGLGRPWGLGAAVVAFGAYNCLQIALYGVFGVTAGKMFGERPWWFWSLIAWAVVHPAPEANVAAALSPGGLTLSTGSVAGAVAVLCFVGFELAPVYREEARHATRTIVAATGAALLSMLGTYGLAAWAMVVHYGPGRVVGVARDLGPEMLFRLGGDGWLATAGRGGFLFPPLSAAICLPHTGLPQPI